MTDRKSAFVVSLDRAEPPPIATPTLRAVWHGLRGDWSRCAHRDAPSVDTRDEGMEIARSLIRSVAGD